jgi:hypothetical protein
MTWAATFTQRRRGPALHSRIREVSGCVQFPDSAEPVFVDRYTSMGQARSPWKPNLRAMAEASQLQAIEKPPLRQLAIIWPESGSYAAVAARVPLRRRSPASHEETAQRGNGPASPLRSPTFLIGVATGSGLAITHLIPYPDRTP